MRLEATAGFEKHGRAMLKAVSPVRMEGLVPWSEFCALIEAHDPMAGNGRSSVGLERMLHLLAMFNINKMGTTSNRGGVSNVAGRRGMVPPSGDQTVVQSMKNVIAAKFRLNPFPRRCDVVACTAFPSF